MLWLGNSKVKLGKVYYAYPRTRRMKKRFALFPKILSDHEQIWLESYYSFQTFGPKGLCFGGYLPPSTWNEDFSCSTKKELKEKLRKDYREKKRAQKSWEHFLNYLP